MKRQIQRVKNGLKIEISENAENKKELLKEFEKCQAGTCSCPSNEYIKLDEMNVEESTGIITITLKAKKGHDFDADEIEKCLDHAEKQTKLPR